MAYRSLLLQEMAQGGYLEELNWAIRERLRVRLNRNAQPSVGIVDNQ